jgi:phospholipid transport system substrate-binding protein
MTKTLAAWFLIAAAAANQAVQAPRDVVQTAVNRVLTVLEPGKPAADGAAAPRQPERSQVERVRAEVRKVAGELFDFDEIARRTLSRHWVGRSKAEQAEFSSLFADLLERSYVGRIVNHSGERIVYTGEVLDGDYATVKSRVFTRRKTETALDYRLHLTEGRWKVYDVVVDGVSMVSTYRNEFNRVIQSSSFEELVDRLRRKTVAVRPLSGPAGQD